MFVQSLLFALKGIPYVKYEKKTIDNGRFFTFFTTLDLIWHKFCPKTTPTLIFLKTMKYLTVSSYHARTRLASLAKWLSVRL